MVLRAVAITLVAVFGVFQYSNSLLISLTGVCDNGGVAVDQVLTHCNADLSIPIYTVRVHCGMKFKTPV